MMLRFNKINKKTINLFKSGRKYSTHSMFINEINRKDVRGDKHGNLVYLSDLFNSYQNFISMPNIRKSRVIGHWQSYFRGANYAKLYDTFSYLHQHENYKQSRESILLNFDDYDAKEIAFICKTHQI